MAINEPIHTAPEPTLIDDPCDLQIDDLRLLYNIRMNQIKISAFPKCKYESVPQILKKIATLGVSIYIVNIHPDEITFAIYDRDTASVESTLKEDGYSANIVSQCANVVISSGTARGLSAIIPDLLERLAEKSIPVLHLSVSYTEISLLITEDFLGKLMAVFNEWNPLYD